MNILKKKYASYHLFNTKEISPSLSHTFCPNQFREIDINIYNFIVEPKDKQVQKFITIRKPWRCALSCFCACCSRPTFIVETPIEKLGTILELRTICDPIVKILDAKDNPINAITTKCNDCGYFMRDECCNARRWAKCLFLILDAEQKQIMGKIQKDHRSGKRIKPDYDQIVVVFPLNVSCEDKILIMCAALIL